jgi:hypothetical protein
VGAKRPPLAVLAEDLSAKILVALILVLKLQFYLPKGLTNPWSSRYNPRNLSEGAP